MQARDAIFPEKSLGLGDKTVVFHVGRHVSTSVTGGIVAVIPTTMDFRG